MIQPLSFINNIFLATHMTTSIMVKQFILLTLLVISGTATLAEDSLVNGDSLIVTIDTLNQIVQSDSDSVMVDSLAIATTDSTLQNIASTTPVEPSASEGRQKTSARSNS